MGDQTFEAWVDGLITTRFRTQDALAKAIGMTAPPFGRGVKSGTLSIENLLRLAKVSDTDPSLVLRLAGKPHVADLIEELYGSAAQALTDTERRVLRYWHGISQPSLRATALSTLLAFSATADRPSTDHGSGGAGRGGGRRRGRGRGEPPRP